MKYVYAEISIQWHTWRNRMERWIRFFRSYVICQISGPDVERFLNMCRHRDITFFDMCREADGIRAGILVEDFKRIKPMAVITRTKIHIKRRRGVRFLLHRYRRRRGFVLGFLLFIVILSFLTSHIWAFEFEGNSRYTDEKLVKYLDTQRIRPGVRVSAISGSELEENIRLTFPDISWVSVQTKGSVLMIHLEEMIPPRTEQEDTRVPALVAACDGEIVAMVTRSGTPVTTLGQTVAAGDMLINGYESIKDDNGEVLQEKYVGADGDIYAKVQEDYEKIYPAVTEVKQYGPSHPKYTLRLGDHGLSMAFGLPEENYDVFTEILTPWPDLFPWISLQKDFYRAFETVPSFTSLAQLKAQAQADLQATLENYDASGIQVLENHVAIETGTDSVKASGYFTVIRSIGQPSVLQPDPTGSALTADE